MSLITPDDISRMVHARLNDENEFERLNYKARVRCALVVLLRDLDRREKENRDCYGNSTCEVLNTVFRIAERLGCEPTHEAILAHFEEHGHEEGYFLKLTPSVLEGL